MPVVYRALYEGVQQGLQISLEESKKPENANNPNIVVDVVAAMVFEHLRQVINFDDELLQLKESLQEKPEAPIVTQ